MKVVILAGGFGTRISEETAVIPKPLVEIGGKPVLWHIMKMYSHYGFNDFVICCGYKGHLIKSYFMNFFTLNSDITVNLEHNNVMVHRSPVEPWRVTMIDTGLDTMTGGRIKRIRNYIGGEAFCLTYGDGVSDINVRALVDFHRSKKVLATVTAVRTPGRFGVMHISEDESLVTGFREKSAADGNLINGGFFVLEPGIMDYIGSDDTVWEQEPMVRLVADGHLAAYQHDGFWQNMDTLRDKNVLEAMWDGGKAPWRIWRDDPR